jgi:hypothetical protein
MVVGRPKVSFYKDGSTRPGKYGWLFVCRAVFLFCIHNVYISTSPSLLFRGGGVREIVSREVQSVQGRSKVGTSGWWRNWHGRDVWSARERITRVSSVFSSWELGREKANLRIYKKNPWLQRKDCGYAASKQITKCSCLTSRRGFPGTRPHQFIGWVPVWDSCYCSDALGAGHTGCDSRHLQKIILFSTASRQVPGAHPTSRTMEKRGLFIRSYSGLCVNLTTHLHLVSKSRMMKFYLHFPIRLPDVMKQIFTLHYLNHWAFSCRLSTAAPQARSQVRSCEICGG